MRRAADGAEERRGKEHKETETKADQTHREVDKAVGPTKKEDKEQKTRISRHTKRETKDRGKKIHIFRSWT